MFHYELFCIVELNNFYSFCFKNLEHFLNFRSKIRVEQFFNFEILFYSHAFGHTYFKFFYCLQEAEAATLEAISGSKLESVCLWILGTFYFLRILLSFVFMIK